MLRQSIFLLALITASGLFAQTTQVAHACPMCKVANETDAYLPRAYMYSILFMLGMPATICASLGVGLYRLNQKESAGLEAIEQSARGTFADTDPQAE